MENTTTATAALDSGQTTSSEPSFVQSILTPTLGDASATSNIGKPEKEPQPQATPQTEHERPAPEETAPPAGELPTVEQLIAEFAQEHPDLDPQNPNHQKVLKRLADKELFIRKQQAKILGEARNGAPKETAPEELTAFERALQADASKTDKPAEKAPETAPDKPAAAQPERMKFGDIGDSWQSPKDAYAALGEAYQANDIDKAKEIEDAMFARRYFEMAQRTMPSLQSLIERIVEQRYGTTLRPVQEQLEDDRIAQLRGEVVGELKATKGNEDIEDLLTPDDKEPVLEYEGMQFPNNAINRAFAAHPELLEIRATHKDPAVADRLTLTKQFRAAASYARLEGNRNNLDPAKAQQLVDAGKTLAQKAEQDRVRQGLNAGNGATGLGSNAAPTSFVKGLSPSGEISFSSLFQK